MDNPRFEINGGPDEIFQWGIFDNERVLQTFTFLPSEEVALTLLAAINTAYGL